jgi:uncharacterized membrane protein
MNMKPKDDDRSYVILGGVSAIIIGSVFVVWGLSVLLDHNATITVNEVPSSDPWIKASVLVGGLIIVGTGVWKLLTRCHRPKE